MDIAPSCEARLLGTFLGYQHAGAWSFGFDIRGEDPAFDESWVDCNPHRQRVVEMKSVRFPPLAAVTQTSTNITGESSRRGAGFLGGLFDRFKK